MPESNWYRDKAEECGRRAALASTPLTRDGLLRDQKNWQEIADRIAATEAKLAVSFILKPGVTSKLVQLFRHVAKRFNHNRVREISQQRVTASLECDCTGVGGVARHGAGSH